jgi:hypothetical protein
MFPRLKSNFTTLQNHEPARAASKSDFSAEAHPSKQVTCLRCGELYVNPFTLWTYRTCMPCARLREKENRAAYQRPKWKLQEKAIRKVRYAVSRGRLPHPATLLCVDCTRPAEVYDHRDYTKPLDVAPVCMSCNGARGPSINKREGSL